MRKVATSLLLALLVSFAGDAGAAPPTDAPIAIEHATVYVPAGPPLKDATVVIAGGAIRAVGNGVAVPPNARRIDANNHRGQQHGGYASG